MAFEKGDSVVLHDEHSDYDGEVGTVDQVMDTMFGDSTYNLSFEDGQEQGVPEDALEAADVDVDDEAEAGSDGADEADASEVEADEA